MIGSCDISVGASLATIIRSPAPEIPAYLNEILAADDFCAGVEPLIGRKHIRVIALDGFPRTSFPGILGEIDSLADGIPLEHSRDTCSIPKKPEASSIRTAESGVRGFADSRIRSSKPERRRQSLCPNDG